MKMWTTLNWLSSVCVKNVFCFTYKMLFQCHSCSRGEVSLLLLPAPSSAAPFRFALSEDYQCYFNSLLQLISPYWIKLLSSSTRQKVLLLKLIKRTRSFFETQSEVSCEQSNYLIELGHWLTKFLF